MDTNLQRGDKVNDVVQKKPKKKGKPKKPKQNDGVLKEIVLRFEFNKNKR
jgi:hypothetical protein